MDQQQAAEVLKKFEEQKLEQAAAFQQQAAESLVKHEQMKKKNNNKRPFDGPIRLGRNIPNDEPVMPMGNILEEERRITIEGFILIKKCVNCVLNEKF